jgi:hypothetical protein
MNIMFELYVVPGKAGCKNVEIGYLGWYHMGTSDGLTATGKLLFVVKCG